MVSIGRHRWSSIDSDPNSRVSRGSRQSTISKVLVTPPIEDRVELILSYCREKRVLDIGCVHLLTEVNKDKWLHRRIRDVADSCIGADINAEGVDRMNALGYEAVVLDMGNENISSQKYGLFDVIVAGEILEHMDKPGNLFANASNLLSESGVLILTTPNPYVWRRIVAAKMSQLVESVDHVFYAYPSGIVEYGERSGLRVQMITTVSSYSLARAFREVVAFISKSLSKQLKGHNAGGQANTPTGRTGLRALLDVVGSDWSDLPV